VGCSGDTNTGVLRYAQNDNFKRGRSGRNTEMLAAERSVAQGLEELFEEVGGYCGTVFGGGADVVDGSGFGG
jgi:hypothetical protein